MHRRKKTTQRRVASPDDYRHLAEESVRRCLAMPVNRRRSRAVEIIIARAWDRLADQAEEWRRDHPPAAAA
jgi:hypothetical protein